jgi:hypothetical protein
MPLSPQLGFFLTSVTQTVHSFPAKVQAQQHWLFQAYSFSLNYGRVSGIFGFELVLQL